MTNPPYVGDRKANGTMEKVLTPWSLILARAVSMSDIGVSFALSFHRGSLGMLDQFHKIAFL